MKRITLIVLILVLLSVLVGCVERNEPEISTKPTTPVVLVTELGNSGATDYRVSRFIDKEAGVVCWISKVSYGYAISCLPLKDTLLH